MSEFDEKVQRLQQRLNQLIKEQERFQKEIAELRAELLWLKPPARRSVPDFPKPSVREPETAKPGSPPPEWPADQRETKQKTTSDEPERPTPKYEPIFNKEKPKPAPKPQSSSNLEKFIGENLISKIGIVILVIGVAIGAKFAIDNNLISPLARIILGYAFGIGLTALAVRLRAKYLNFSAVLLSGGMAIMYFITFFAYTLYSLINQPTAFVLMVIFTLFTVASALQYNRQVIAHMGLVGAYAVPFLLSDNSGNYLFLFSYVAIINLGILAVSVKKYWKPLFYSSFLVTWFIFNGWYAFRYSAEEHFYLGMGFAGLFFLIFYLTFLAYKLVSKQNVAAENVALVLTNSFIFYGFGYSMLKRGGFENFLGAFTVLNAGIHLAFAFGISRLKLGSRDLVYLTAALVLTFITIAVPVQVDGNFITLIWTAEAAILFWIGRTRQIQLFEWFSYPLMGLASISLLNDWGTTAWRYLDKNEVLFPVFNRYFAVGLFFVLAFAFIWYLTHKRDFESVLPKEIKTPVNFIIAAILLFALYNIFRAEIGNFYTYRLAQTEAPISIHKSYTNFNIIWQLNYTMLFLTGLAFFNIKKIKSAFLGFANLGLNGLTVFTFLTIGLIALGKLRRMYLQTGENVLSDQGIYNLLIRYISYIFFALISYASFRYIKQEFLNKYIPAPVLQVFYDLGLHLSILIILSVELITWTDIFDISGSFKLGLSILWGVYAVFLIVLGIIYKRIQLRIFAIILFAVTLFKLFIYDIAELDTISKTVVFVSLGILLLTVSFLYTKYRKVIFE